MIARKLAVLVLAAVVVAIALIRVLEYALGTAPDPVLTLAFSSSVGALLAVLAGSHLAD